jgi:hypothetical protein
MIDTRRRVRVVETWDRLSERQAERLDNLMNEGRIEALPQIANGALTGSSEIVSTQKVEDVDEDDDPIFVKKVPANFDIGSLSIQGKWDNSLKRRDGHESWGDLDEVKEFERFTETNSKRKISEMGELGK